MNLLHRILMQISNCHCSSPATAAAKANQVQHSPTAWKASKAPHIALLLLIIALSRFLTAAATPDNNEDDSFAEERANDQPLELPVAFPIFKPPSMANGQRTIDENNRPLRFHSISSSSATNQSALHSGIEEISAPSDNSFPAEEAVEDDSSEEERHQIPQQQNSHLTLMAPMQNGSNSDDNGNLAFSSLASAHTDDEQRTTMPLATLAAANSAAGKTKRPMKMNKEAMMRRFMVGAAGGGSSNSVELQQQQQHFATTTINAEDFSSRRYSPSTLSLARPPVSSSHMHVINTPQFPVFTGMGMEIIDSHEKAENTGSLASSSSHISNERDEQLHRLMHYQRTGIIGGNGINGTMPRNGTNANGFGGATTGAGIDVQHHAVPIQIVHLSTLGTGNIANANTPQHVQWQPTTIMANAINSSALPATTTTTTQQPNGPKALTTTTAIQSVANEHQRHGGATLFLNHSSSPVPVPSTMKSGVLEKAGEEHGVVESAFRTEATTTSSSTVMPTATTGFPLDEVTEDLLAMLHNHQASTPTGNSASNNNKNGHKELEVGHLLSGQDELDNGFERITQQMGGSGDGNAEEGGGPPIAAAATTTPSNAVLTRPTTTAPAKGHGGQESSATTLPITTSTTTTTTTRVLTRFPLLWTTSSSSNRNNGTTTTTTSTMATPPPVLDGGNSVEPNGATTNGPAAMSTREGGNKLIEWPQSTTQTTRTTTTTEWAMSNNNLEEEEEGEWQQQPERGKSGNDEHGNGRNEGRNNQRPTETLERKNKQQIAGNGNNNNNGVRQENADHEAINNNNVHAQSSSSSAEFNNNSNGSKFAKTVGSLPSTNANLRLYVMAGVILVLLVIIAAGGVCTGRYVKKSRQLHGKYRPAAYEMQNQQRYQPDYVLPQHAQQQHNNNFGMPQQYQSQQQQSQQQATIMYGKEERLI